MRDAIVNVGIGRRLRVSRPGMRGNHTRLVRYLPRTQRQASALAPRLADVSVSNS